MQGHNGGVWEWTSTVFDTYDGFVPSKLYPGYVVLSKVCFMCLCCFHRYSADFFDGAHQVVVRFILYSISLPVLNNLPHSLVVLTLRSLVLLNVAVCVIGINTIIPSLGWEEGLFTINKIIICIDIIQISI